MKDLSNEAVIHIKKDGIEYLQFRRLLEYSADINHAYYIGLSRDFRTEQADNQPVSEAQLKAATANYTALTNAIGTSYDHLVRARQNHTKAVKAVLHKGDSAELYNPAYAQTDGLATSVPNALLSTTNADCILLLFYDPVKKVIANTHSGWKGTLQRISVETVKKMRDTYGTNPSDIICCICPSIRKCHFEVDKPVKDQFASEFTDVTDYIEETEPGKKWHIDTVRINKEILKNAGLKAENIIDSGLCSVCESDQIHSFRVEGEKYGLATAIIEIRG